MKTLCALALSLVIVNGKAIKEKLSFKDKIKHVVVLMMENRSFDHLLGWLKQDYNNTIDGLNGDEKLPRDPTDLTKGYLSVNRNGYDVSPDDPRHGYDDIALQMNDNNMNGFVFDSIINNLNESNPISMFDKTSAPITNMLAMEFALFDRWFCSVPTGTDPNRAFSMSGTSKGILTNFNGTLYDQQSYFDYIRRHNRTFAGYYQDDLWALGYFEDLNMPENRKFIYDLETNFYDHVQKGELADFVWLQPRTSARPPNKLPTWQHPDASIKEGEKLIKEVYEALRAGPKWEETLFIITYDEHGGFYDHVTPPYKDIPAPDDNIASNGFAFDRLGVRIPTIVISPWIPRGTIVHDALPGEQPTLSSAFEGTSVIATAHKILGLTDEKIPPLGNRMAWTNTFATIVDTLDEPRRDCPRRLLNDREHKLFYSEVHPDAVYEVQRKKPLNEHLEGQLLFFCARNYPLEFANGECPGRPELMYNQGLASDWIAKEQIIYEKNMRNQQMML